MNFDIYKKNIAVCSFKLKKIMALDKSLNNFYKYNNNLDKKKINTLYKLGFNKNINTYTLNIYKKNIKKNVNDSIKYYQNMLNTYNEKNIDIQCVQCESKKINGNLVLICNLARYSKPQILNLNV